MPQARTMCFPNAEKTWLVTKQSSHDEAKNLFAGTGVNVTSDGRPYLGAAIGSKEYVKTYAESKTIEWLKCLAEIGVTQPHAAYSALTHGMMSKWTYLSRTTPDIGPLLSPIDDAIRTDLIPALTGRPPPNDIQCKLFALPARLGGLGISIPSVVAEEELQSSLLVTSTLSDHILSQDPATTSSPSS